MVKNEKIDHISLKGETLCLDFTNTVHNRVEVPAPDYFEGISDLIAWGEKAGAIEGKTAKNLENWAILHAKKAENFFREAIRLRELLYRIFRAVSDHKKVQTSDLEQFNNALSHYFSYLQIKYSQGSFSEEWKLDAENPEQITAPVVRDAYTLLLSGKTDRIKGCPHCGWLFLDTTKNGKRRWCSMKTCGSNVKALEWYYRNKQG